MSNCAYIYPDRYSERIKDTAPSLDIEGMDWEYSDLELNAAEISNELMDWEYSGLELNATEISNELMDWSPIEEDKDDEKRDKGTQTQTQKTQNTSIRQKR